MIINYYLKNLKKYLLTKAKSKKYIPKLPSVVEEACRKSDAPIKIPEKYLKEVTYKDVVILFTFHYSDDSFLASAYPCVQDSETKRPLMGVLVINTRTAMTKSLLTDVSTVIHEILHILGFSTILFPFFPKVDHQFVYYLKDDNIHYYRGQRLISEIKTHFACDSITEGKKYFV